MVREVSRNIPLNIEGLVEASGQAATRQKNCWRKW